MRRDAGTHSHLGCNYIDVTARRLIQSLSLLLPDWAFWLNCCTAGILAVQ